MKKITIAFDVDWTLIKARHNCLREICPDDMNIRIIELLKILSSFKNTRVIVWSGQWEDWAKWVSEVIWITKYVDWYASKNHRWKIDWKHIFEPGITPDIAIDDIQDCELGIMNLIVKEK